MQTDYMNKTEDQMKALSEPYWNTDFWHRSLTEVQGSLRETHCMTPQDQPTLSWQPEQAFAISLLQRGPSLQA